MGSNGVEDGAKPPGAIGRVNGLAYELRGVVLAGPESPPTRRFAAVVPCSTEPSSSVTGWGSTPLSVSGRVRISVSITSVTGGIQKSRS
ncbi:hypothetical protein [Mycolicibacterium gilvum]|uniref:hypothetical protein n=1 Tax=Mycolicibacterium gilvum TaxID=1804 RepID=UPI004045E4B9